MIDATFRGDALAGRVALVVGGTGGIGAAIASGLAQVGAKVRVTGATQQEVDDAKAYGSVIIGARDVHRNGGEAALAQIPDHARYFITFDADGMIKDFKVMVRPLKAINKVWEMMGAQLAAG